MDVELLEEYRKSLELRRAEVTVAMQKAIEQERDRSAAIATQDSADKAADSYEKELLYSLSHESRVALQHCDAALKRIKNGSFGVCDACGEEIEARRLKALPWAGYCLSCQDKKERGVLDLEREEES